MMKTYNISLHSIRQTKDMQEMLSALERGFAKYNIDYYLIGAVSRDVWMSGVHHIKPKRGTTDIDFAVFINDKGVYEELKAYLVSVEEFNEYRENAFVLLWNNGLQVDLLPFGRIEDDNRNVTVRGTGFTSVNVDGLREVYDHLNDEAVLGDDHTFKVCPIPSYVLLKLIAWDDRPDMRRDDIMDIADIVHHFFDMQYDNILEHHYDLLDDDFDPLLIGARMIGREMKTVVADHPKLYERLVNILQTNSTDVNHSPIGNIMRTYFDYTVEDAVKVIKTMLNGLEEDVKTLPSFS